jgi:hypothetical protein
MDVGQKKSDEYSHALSIASQSRNKRDKRYD